MDPHVFAEIEDVNRLHLSHYWLKSKEGTKPIAQRIPNQIVFSGDRGEPASYRVELIFERVLYLDCPFQLFSPVHWRMARPEEGQRVFPAETLYGTYFDDVRRKSQVYCLELGTAASDHPPSAAWDEKEAPQVPQDHPSRRTFYIVAASVQIVVSDAGEDLETYLEDLRQRALSDQRARSERTIKVLTRRFTDITVMNSLQKLHYKFRELEYERVSLQAAHDYWWADITFYKVEYLSCPTYLDSNFRWRLALPDEAAHVLERYRTPAGDRERTQGECHVYGIEENLEWRYHPPIQRAPHTFYIVAQGVEIQVSFGGEDFDKLGISHFQ